MRDLRTEVYGQTRAFTWVDRLGRWLSLRAIKRHLPRHRSDLSVLDIGCGYHATNLIALLPVLREGVGIDFSIDSRVKNNSRLQFLEMSAEDAMPLLPSKKFDCIILISVLEHLWNPVDALKECHRLLASGGVVLINVPTWRGKFYLEFSAYRLGTSPAAEMDDHKMYYDVRDLWPMLVQAGFKPGNLSLHYHKFGLNLFAIARRNG